MIDIVDHDATKEAVFLGNEIIKLGYIQYASKGDTHCFHVDEKKILLYQFCDELMKKDMKGVALVVNSAHDENRLLLCSSSDEAKARGGAIESNNTIRNAMGIGSESDQSDASSSAIQSKDNKTSMMEIKNLREDMHNLQNELNYNMKQI